MNEHNPLNPLALDPQAAATISALRDMAKRIEAGQSVGAMLLRMDHSTGAMDTVFYMTGDLFRLGGILTLIRDQILARTQQKEHSNILLPRH